MPDPDPLLSTLEALERMEAAATGGPWIFGYQVEEAADGMSVTARGGNPSQGVGMVCEITGKLGGLYQVDFSTPRTLEHQETNGRLIAAARNALPTLLALARLAIEAEESDDSAVDTPRVLSMDWNRRLAALRAGAGPS